MTPFLRRLMAMSSGRDPGDERVRVAALGAALAKINHDLRNALSTVVLAADRLAASNDPVVSRLVPKLVETLERSSELASAALNTAGKDAPGLAVERFALHDLVAEIERELAASDRTGAQLLWANLVPADAEIEADRALLGGALLQIGRNAVENGAGELRVSFARESGRVRIALADDGPGLSAAARDMLFTPFLGVGRARGMGAGLGLGLVLVRDLVRAHGGEFRMTSTGTGGTTFVIELPATISRTAHLWI